MSDQIAPGWYTDPQDPARLRYWDGAAWTEHLQQGGHPGAASSPAHGVPGAAGPGGGLESRLAALEEAVEALERRLDRAGEALAGEEPPGGG